MINYLAKRESFCVSFELWSFEFSQKTKRGEKGWLKKTKKTCFSFQESLLEIDEEEDKTDFCEPFFASTTEDSSAAASVSSSAASLVAAAAAEFPSSTSSSFLSLRGQENIGWIYAKLVESRFCRHNKDLRLICADGSAQIDAIIVMPVLQPTSVLGQYLMLLGDNRLTEALTVMLPDFHLHDLHQILTLLHKVRNP